MPNILSNKQLDNKIHFLLDTLKKEGKIVNIGSCKQSKWTIKSVEK